MRARSLIRTPYDRRRERLRDVLTESEHVAIPPAHTGRLEQAMAVSMQLQLEGVVAKRMDSTYLTGSRRSAWIKLDFHVHQEVVVVGVHEGQGSRACGVGTLLLAVPNNDGYLQYVDKVGAGFIAVELGEIEKKLAAVQYKTPPVSGAAIDDVWWVSPKCVAEVLWPWAGRAMA